MKSFAAVACMTAFAAASRKYDSNAGSQDDLMYSTFLTSFGYGLTGSNNFAAMDACLADKSTPVEDSFKAVELLKDDYLKGYYRLHKVWSNLDTDCSNREMAQIWGDGKFMNAWDELYLNSSTLAEKHVTNWTQNKEQILQYVEQMQNDWDMRQPSAAGKDLAEIIKLGVSDFGYGTRQGSESLVNLADMPSK